MLNSIEEVTAQQVQDIARIFFEAKQMNLAMLGNLGDFKIRREELHC